MEFKVINKNEDIQIILIKDNQEVAKATCYFKGTPKVNGENIGCIGDLEIKSIEFGNIILKKCEEILKEKNLKFIVAPMNRNTWNKYRTLKYTNGDSIFLLENVNSIEYNKILLDSGYKELYTYTSNKGLIEDAYTSEALEFAEKILEKENIIIRKFEKVNYLEDLKKIYNISKISFSKNPLYTESDEKSFLEQYEKYIEMVDDELILIAEKDGKEIGFVFCIPDYNEPKEGKKLETLILKTIAVLPEYQELAIGNILLNKISKIAKKKGFKKWIFAFMYSNNTSQKMAKRNKAQIMREYAIYGKEI